MKEEKRHWLARVVRKDCDHLIVEHRPTQQVVGTYRLQTGTSAGRNMGYYSAREFDFTPYPTLVRIEAACVALPAFAAAAPAKQPDAE